VFENRMLRRIVGPKMEKGDRRLEEILNGVSYPVIFTK
jgi:hypothetical protein